MNGTTERLQNIANGRGVKYILNEAAEITGNPILIHDLAYQLVASADVQCDDRFWLEFMEHGRMSAEAVEFFKDEGFIETVANSTLTDGAVFLISENLRYDRVFGQIFDAQRLPVADLIAVASVRPFEADTPEHILIICEKLSAEFNINNTFLDYGQTYQESVIIKLLTGGYEDKGLHADHVANIDRKFKGNIYAIVADFSRGGFADKNPAECRELLRRLEPDGKYAVFEGKLVMLTSFESPRILVRHELRELNNLFRQHGIFAGVSGRFDNLYRLRDYYDDAVAALERGLERGGGRVIFFSRKR